MCVNGRRVKGAPPPTTQTPRQRVFSGTIFCDGKLDVDVADSALSREMRRRLRARPAAPRRGETRKSRACTTAGTTTSQGFASASWRRIHPRRQQHAAGDIVLGLPSLDRIERFFDDSKISRCAGAISRLRSWVALVDRLMAPTSIPRQALLRLIAAMTVHGLRHINRGGIKTTSHVSSLTDGSHSRAANRGAEKAVFEGCKPKDALPIKNVSDIQLRHSACTVQVRCHDADKAIAI